MISYGVQNEHSDIRAHVCPVVKRVYVYKTVNGVAAIQTGKYALRDAYQRGVSEATAKGYLVPPFDIVGCVGISLSDRAWEYIKFSIDDETTEKGKKAERLIYGMVKSGLFPIPAFPETIKDGDIQISGCDIIIRGAGITHDDIIIQVKCDYNGGERSLGGTGNLYLQIAETNPLGKH